jgi:16S rRNA (cytosine967-C5)-methyltransferase
MKERNQLNHIFEAISKYDCSIPVSAFLKSWFQKHRNMGSNDRRTMRTFVYNYFRLGKCLTDLKMEERIAISSFLIAGKNTPLIDYCISTLTSLPYEKISLPLDEKIKLVAGIYPGFDLNNIFPFQKYLSADVSTEEFYKSFLVQPNVWIRVRKKFKEAVLEELNKNNIEFTEVSEIHCAFGILNSVQLENLKSFKDGYFEIQDMSSQKTGDFFQPKENEHWWDCCAGSGGKSLLLSEQNNSIKITATDNRDSILKNLEERFQKASIRNFEVLKLDLSSSDFRFPTSVLFDGLIADVPCSGSGTWSRTPEMLSCFNESEIEKYSAIQKEILKNVTPYIKKGKPLIYITCSVFKNENEDIVDFAINNLGFQLDKMELIKGYDKKVDTLFAARLIRL